MAKNFSVGFLIFKIKLYRMFFYWMESILGNRDKRDPWVEVYFNQALQNIQADRRPVALLNLNMTLHLNPLHFWALIMRARLHTSENKKRLGLQDYLQACKTFPSRFFANDLQAELLDCYQGNDFESRPVALSDQILCARNLIDSTDIESQDFQTAAGDLFAEKVDPLVTDESDWEGSLELSDDEKEKFRHMGRITQEEIDATDWNQVAQKLLF
ncbi:MAG: hypothetical protein G3M78_06590 [Candidatus Nitrohelix vancouverensis]|uniref:Uncharacterized protein n=1 Tax=Candidatus Nitrohelix vancouverensis TaxID=2705534 RepID=A0A7T0C1Z6_9BACT|nr:MAG: hypothetical protein G3M78_06590 [Candidatus Nitrohelix vancouverensis]